MKNSSHAASITIAFLATLTLVLDTPAVAQIVDDTPPPPTATYESAPAAEADSTESGSATDSSRCPSCGCQRAGRGWGPATSRRDDTAGPRGCRCGQGCAGGRGRGAQSGPEAGWGRGRQGRGKQAEMAAYRALLENHASIERTFEKIPGGIRSSTTTSDPQLVAVLRRHVSQMIDLMESGGWIRIWDPLFAEIFEHADKIETSVEEIEGGVAVTETSDDEQVALLIQAHAVKVMEFVERGQEAYEEPTPLPEGYAGSGL